MLWISSWLASLFARSSDHPCANYTKQGSIPEPGRMDRQLNLDWLGFSFCARSIVFIHNRGDELTMLELGKYLKMLSRFVSDDSR